MADNSVTVAPTDGTEILSPAQVVDQVRLIQQMMHQVMHRDEHYGVIPGCGPKPTLLKPGAEKLCLTFGLVPEFLVQQTDLPGGHREYRVTCRLYTRRDHRFAGEGIGVCTTMERRYRYRWDNTGRTVPAEYWQTRNPDLLGGLGCEPRKQGDRWWIYRRTEHTDPADYYNTVLKIAKKRAHVDATITATAASDIFAQDLEDLTDSEIVVVPEPSAPAPRSPKQPESATPSPRLAPSPSPLHPPSPPPAPPPTPPPAPAPAPSPTTILDGPPVQFCSPAHPPDDPERLITDEEAKRIFVAAKKHGLGWATAVKPILNDLGYRHTKEVRVKHLDRILGDIEALAEKGNRNGRADTAV